MLLVAKASIPVRACLGVGGNGPSDQEANHEDKQGEYTTHLARS